MLCQHCTRPLKIWNNSYLQFDKLHCLELTKAYKPWLIRLSHMFKPSTTTPKSNTIVADVIRWVITLLSRTPIIRPKRDCNRELSETSYGDVEQIKADLLSWIMYALYVHTWITRLRQSFNTIFAYWTIEITQQTMETSKLYLMMEITTPSEKYMCRLKNYRLCKWVFLML